MKYKLFATSLIAAAIWSNAAKADEQACLIEAVYFEARSESFMAQLAVANVIIERVKRNSYPKTICGVVRQGVYRNGKPENISNTRAYEVATNVSKLAMQGAIVAHTEGATHYHATYVEPYWAFGINFTNLGQVGNHIFYIDTQQRGVYNEHNK